MWKILTVVGARPQFVKAAVISRHLAASNNFDEVLIHTGQHFDENMSKVFFDELEIPAPKYNLGISNLAHGAMTGRMLEAIEDILIAEKPDLLLVYGDTNSTLAGALAAKKLHIKIAHVEAGLRSFDTRMPEEVNRILTDRMSDLLFCPTTLAVENLKREGFENFDCVIRNTGDVMYDAVLRAISLEPKSANANARESFALCTIHRAENTDDLKRLRSIFEALDRIHKEMPVVLPIHPRTKELVQRHGINTSVRFTDPLGHLEMLKLIGRSAIVLTDSGGLQKEAYFLKKICITLRDTTEWMELVENSVNFIAGSESDRIIAAFERSKTLDADFSTKLYGDGNAGGKIVDQIQSYLMGA
ncbi:MAG: UDP-N-acetylglucosamine 2-epimerase (non-hydrolyzing) [Acidobacteriota bacterium]